MNNFHDINFFTRFFLFCAGVSLDIISKCPKFEIIKYVSIGATIFFTAILALISSFFAFSIIFDSIQFVVFCSVFWSFIIFNLDRYIVSSIRYDENFLNKTIKAFPRILIGIFIAITISKPIEVKLLSTEIREFIDLEKNNKIQELDLVYKNTLEDLAIKKNKIIESYNVKLDLQEKYYDDFKCECDGTCGTLIKGRGVECLSKKNKYDNYLVQMNFERTQYENLILENSNEKKFFTEKYQKDQKTINASFSYGFFNQIKILNKLDNISIYFIMLLFILIELSPIITKLFSNNGPYDSLLMSKVNEYKLGYFKSLDNLKNERMMNDKINKLGIEKEFQNKKYEMEKIINKKALDQYEKLKDELENKISQN